ncbi:MAG: leucyl aminopeptidase [Tepidisphaeraceae bacterium]|jgi:leucyl aminopeptidase
MIPTSTDVSIEVAPAAGKADAVALFIVKSKSSKPHEDAGFSADVSAAAQRLVAARVSTGKASEVVFDLLASKKRVYVVGLGKPDKITLETLRQAAGGLARALIRHHIASAAVALPPLQGIADKEAAGAIVEGVLLAAFDYREYKGTASKSDDPDDSKAQRLSVTVVANGKSLASVRSSVHDAKILCEAQNLARTIASRPGNDVNPPVLAREAKDLSRQTGLRCTIYDDKQLKRMKMGGILAVGAGSIHAPPRLIVLEHKPRNLPRSARPVLLVGKAITFDTGGISIKPADKMGKMIFDKCGAMAVLGCMVALARLKIPAHVVGILSSAENSISSLAYRPGDILRMFNGVTVEVTNTDAEGRLVLADALAWGIKTYNPEAAVDLATLTGGVIVALGKTMAGVMSNNDDLVKQIQSAADATGEKFWRLPLGDDQRQQIKSDVADIVNSAGREGHPLQGGAFLSYFLPKDDSVPWAHLDIAGVADTEKELPYYGKGATGWGVRTLVQWIASRVTGPVKR